MKWIYRIMVLIVAGIIFTVTFMVNFYGTHRGHPALLPFAPLMTAGMYLVGMRMVTENIECYRWKISMAAITLLIALAVFV